VQGTAPLTYSRGLLPLTYAETTPGSGTLCTASVSAPRCAPNFVAWTGAGMTGGTTYAESCTTTATQVSCTFHYRYCTSASLCGTTTTVAFTVAATASNVGMAMRRLNSSATGTTGITTISSLTGVLNSDASATVTLSGEITAAVSDPSVSDATCSLGALGDDFDCKTKTVSFPITLLADHPILDSTDGTYGWLLRNKWHEVAYYVVQSDFVPGGSRACTDTTSCLTVNYHTTATGVADAGKQRALILLSGRTLTGASRPNATLADWFEGANADGVTPFEVRSATLVRNTTFNDRVAVLSANP
jgi:hypothetical protein